MAPTPNAIDLTNLISVKLWLAANQVTNKQFTIPASGPYTIQTTALQDDGVLYSTGVAFVAVPSAPTVGQYTFANGLYTFNSADNAKIVSISYLSSGADDQTIQDCITAFSAYVLKQTGRGPSDGSIPTASPFVAPVAYNEWYDGSGSIRQFVRQWPIQSVSVLAIGPLSIPLSTAWNVPGFVIDEGKKSLSLRGGGGGYVGGILRVGFWNTTYNGCGYRFWEGPQNVNVQYTAGFSGVPEDLELMARKVVSLNYKRRGWIGQKSLSMANGAGTTTYGTWEMEAADVNTMQYYRRNAIV